MSDIEYEVSDYVATITLNRPERKNAFNLEMLDAWADHLRTANRDPNVRVVVLRGAGGAFCAGVDLDVFAGRERTPLAEKQLLDERVHQVAFAADALTKPYLASVGGVAVGAGMDMSLMCDMRFAATSARFSEGYVRVGLVPGDGGCYYLPRIVGTAKALDLLWSGRFVGAEEALAIGLVSDVFPDDEHEDKVTEVAQKFAAMPPVAVSLIKRSVRDASRHDLRTALDLISSHQAVVTSTEDSREAMAAFREGRKATFAGR